MQKAVHLTLSVSDRGRWGGTNGGRSLPVGGADAVLPVARSATSCVSWSKESLAGE